MAHASTLAHTARTTVTSPNEAGIDPFEAFGNRSRHPDGAIPHLCAAGLCRRQAWPSTMQNPSTPRYLTLPARKKAAFILGPGMVRLHGRLLSAEQCIPHFLVEPFSPPLGDARCITVRSYGLNLDVLTCPR